MARLLAAAACVSLVYPVLCPGAAAAAPSVAIFPFELIDDSQEGEANGPREDETKRIGAITAELRDLVAKDGRYVPVDLAPLAAEIVEKAPLYKCNDCEIDLAKKAGAELAMIATVQKVSNLILNLNLYIRDVASGERKKTMSVDIRGNTDETWSRSLRYLLKNQLFAEGVKQ